MSLFGIKKQESKKVPEKNARVKVLGGGCTKCNELEKATVEALTELGMDTSIEHVTDFSVIATYGVMTTPALVVDGKVLSYGKVLSKNEAIALLKEACPQKPKVAFVCNHNSCRSQIAEALGKELAPDVFDSYSAGTIIKDQINQDAVRMMKKIHNIDMEETQFNKTIYDIPQPDVVIFMGCNVSCPNLKYDYMENWGLDDPSGLSDDVFEQTIQSIYDKVLLLKETLSKQ